MTGYGIAHSDTQYGHYTVEIKSLNSKFLELNLKVPKSFSDRELFLRNECSRLLERGKINLTITAEHNDPALNAASINKPLAIFYYNELKEVADEVGASHDNLLSTVLDLPEVIGHKEEKADETAWNNIYSVFLEATNEFDKFRKDEGEVLKADLTMRTAKILEYLAEIEIKETSRVPLIRERIINYLDDTVGKENVDKNRFEQELIYYIDKLDITEEKVRLKSHCNYFSKALDSEDANGKKLNFISQEMGREINTLGSKANHAEIQQIVVRMKEELEKIKEQLLNVL
ncbi:YicC/YloC family endoribonuclease [Albibacterium indicum]|uniref:YicC/YloC family endoribonuclease n=1 Tax=Albibacterium indicum TaxID=2292082 RepID=UPI0013EF1978|nr:YicC/YloC family endoribonuclease [Pedobacter indicus]